MARQNEYGKYILSAGEIGAYTVCPEAWQLSNTNKKKQRHEKSEEAGQRLHDEWAHTLNEAVFLKRTVKQLALLLILCVVLYLLTGPH